MSDVIHRTTLEQQFSVNTPDYPTSTWIINPDLSAVEGVPKKYWKIVGDNVLEMTQPEKDVVDATESAALKLQSEDRMRTILDTDATGNLAKSVDIDGLTLTVNIQNVIEDEAETFLADPALTKFVRVSYIYGSLIDQFYVNFYTKTDGVYALFGDNEALVSELGEFSVIANGTEFVEVV